MDESFTKHWWMGNAIFGGLVWLVGFSVYLRQPSLLSQLALLLVFGMGVIAPLSIRLAAQPERLGRYVLIYHAAARWHSLVTVCVGAALLLTPSWLAAGLACVWLLQAGVLALCGLARLLPRPTFAVDELCITAGLIYVPVSGIWLVAYCAGYALFTFDPIFVLLTAVHFMFISLGALVILGMAGRQLRDKSIWKAYRVIAWLAVISPALVAAGITLTQYTGQLLLEVSSVILLGGSLLAFALLVVFNRLPSRRWARAWIMLSAGILLVTMSLAIAYAVGRFTGGWSLDLATMVQWHGWLNALGFVFCGLLGWTLA